MTINYTEKNLGYIEIRRFSLVNLTENQFEYLMSLRGNKYNIVVDNLNETYLLFQTCTIVDYDLIDRNISFKHSKMSLMNLHKYRKYKIWTLLKK